MTRRLVVLYMLAVSYLFANVSCANSAPVYDLTTTTPNINIGDTVTFELTADFTGTPSGFYFLFASQFAFGFDTSTLAFVSGAPNPLLPGAADSFLTAPSGTPGIYLGAFSQTAPYVFTSGSILQLEFLALGPGTTSVGVSGYLYDAFGGQVEFSASDSVVISADGIEVVPLPPAIFGMMGGLSLLVLMTWRRSRRRIS